MEVPPNMLRFTCLKGEKRRAKRKKGIQTYPPDLESKTMEGKKNTRSGTISMNNKNDMPNKNNYALNDL